jgi:branched-chain amino acid transport system substrate-binding protein
MTRRSLGVLVATGILAAAAAAPVSAQGPEVTVAEGDPIVIAAYGPITGPLASIGLDWMIAADVAKDDHGGTILGHPIEIQRVDGGCAPDTGATAANLIASNPDVVGVLGGTCSDEVAAGTKTLTDAGLTAISPSATRDLFTFTDRGPEFDGFLRVAFSDRFQGPEVSDFIFNELGLTRVGTIHDGSVYSSGLVGTFTTDFEARGGEITRAESITAGTTTDMGPALTAIAVTEPEAIYFPIFESQGGFILRQVRAIEGLEEVQLVGSDGLFSSTFIDAAGPDVVGMYITAGDQRRFQEGYADMVAKYLEKEGLETTLSAFHAQGYDAANIMFDAIEDVAVDNGDGSHTVNLAALRERLFATENHAGLTGNITCDEFGDCGVPLVAAYLVGPEQVEDEVWPPPAVWPPIE